ncbi:unnamed protein product [Ilex paraguariensis]|uniref:Uncharacterized protein n=1 Tax=Ilex paraguariensis TaxID=185542 RepID=A0ABC8TUR8_9AQUA
MSLENGGDGLFTSFARMLSNCCQNWRSSVGEECGMLSTKLLAKQPKYRGPANKPGVCQICHGSLSDRVICSL